MRDRLGDRFRLLAGGRRGLERQQTLRHAVAWSYDLLTADEQVVLQYGAVFAGGFTVEAVGAVCDGFEEYALLDLLESLVRKSLVTADRSGGHVRYGMLETIRQFAEEQLAATGGMDTVRDRHASCYAAGARAAWELYSGPRIREATDWVDVEFDNLRAGFRWAFDRGDLAAATTLAAHSYIAIQLQRFEPVAWAEELLPAATTADVVQLPRLLTAAAGTYLLGRAEDAVRCAQTAVRLEADPRYDGFEPGLTRMQEAVALFTAGRIDDAMAVLTLMAAGTGVARAIGLGCLLSLLPGLGRAPEARVIAEDTLAAANATGSMIWLLTALYGYGRAHIDSDPVAALDALRQGISLAHQHRLPVWVAIIAQDAAPLEAVHGDLDQAIELFDSTIQACWHSGENVNLAGTLASVVKFFDHRAEPELAATVYGIASNIGTTVYVLGLDAVLDRLRTEIGAARYDQCVAAGTQMEPAEAIPYVRQQLRSTQQRPDPT